MFYDLANSNAKLGNYSFVNVQGNSSSTLNYDSNENAYVLSGTGCCFSGFKIDSLDNDFNDVKIEVECKLTHTSVYNQAVLGIKDLSMSNQFDFCRLLGSEFQGNTPASVSTIYTHNTSFSQDGWFKLVLTKIGNSLTYELYKENTRLGIGSFTSTTLSNICYFFAVQTEMGTEFKTFYRKIKVKLL